ncbi:MAG: DUF5703 domain-containing protein [Verrucomicrobiales bacterium]
MKRLITLPFCVSASVFLAAPVSFGELPFTNLATSAKISASSVLDGDKYAAGNVADGRIAPALCQHFELYPDNKKARSWAVNGEEAKDKGELVLEWEQPVMIQEVVYYGRTAWLMNECFKDFEVYIDDGASPVAKGSFQEVHGPQRVPFKRQKVKKLTLRFLNSHGGPNPGATEILVLGEDVSDKAVIALAPANPPPARKASDPIRDANVIWKTPCAGEEQAMPLGNGKILANVWTEQNGDIRVTLARIEKPGGKATRLGGARFRLDPPLDTSETSLRQSLLFKYGEVVVNGATQPSRPVCSFFVDANRDVLHFQLRASKPVRLTAFLEGEDGKAAPLADQKRVFFGRKDTALVMLCDGMEPRADVSYHMAQPTQACDFQVHIVAAEPAALNDAIKAVAKTDVNGAVTGHLDAWTKFWNKGSIYLGSDEEGASIARALVIRRFLSACSGRGPHPIKPEKPAEKKEVAEREIKRWEAVKAVATINSAIEKAKPYLANNQGKARFPRFWGADYSRLPAEQADIDSFIGALRSMLITSSGKKVCVLPGWPVERDVTFRLDSETGLGVDVAYSGGEIKRLEVYPKQRTSEVFGIGPFEEKVRRALPGPFRMPELISFLSPSWVGPRVGLKNLFVTMKKANFNGLEGSLADLGEAKEAGIYLLLHGVTPWTAYALKDEKTVISYYLSDRRKPSSFPHFGNMRKKYEAIDAYHPTEFTTYSQYGGIEFFLDTVRPRMLEYYDYHWQRQAHLHFHFLEYYRRMSLAAGGIPVFRFVHVHGDNVIKMRQTVAMSIAYGLKGFKWWVGWTMFDIHKVVETEPPPLSDIGREVSGINNTLAAFSPSITNARSVDVYHTDPLPTSTRKAPEDYWLQPSGEHIVMGVFKGEKSEDFITLGNRDIGTKREANLSIKRKVKAVRHLNKQTRKWTDLKLEGAPGNQSVKVPIDKGDIELIRIIPVAEKI